MAAKTVLGARLTPRVSREKMNILWKLWKRVTPNLTHYERRRRIIAVLFGASFAILIVISVTLIMIKLSRPR